MYVKEECSNTTALAIEDVIDSSTMPVTVKPYTVKQLNAELKTENSIY